jgi:DNA (cytosine-5)-methyltransferase 1
MGKQKGFKDARGNLFFEIARIIDAKRPKIIFLENVKNLAEHDSGKTFRVIHNTLLQLGYGVKYKIMNSCEYGNIPQDRNRIFIIAILEHEILNKFTFPEPIKLSKSINDIIDRSIRHHEFFYYREKSQYYSELSKNIKDTESIYRIDDWGVAKNRYSICPTLKANMGTYPDRVPLIKDNFGIRKLTPRECLDFQGFPKNFKFPDISLHSAYKQVGNSVCVPVIFEIAKKLNFF